jgi:esterase/lipase
MEHEVPQGDLNVWLAERERSVAGIIPGTEKHVRWYGDRPGERTRRAIVYFHGFSATRQETLPLADLVADAIGANVFYTRLAGHGIGATALAAARCEDWLQDADEAFRIGRRLGGEIVVMASSTGATLAVQRHLSKRAPAARAYVLLSPNFALRHAASPLISAPGAKLFLRLFIGRTYSFPPVSDTHGRFWTTSYPATALIEMHRLVTMVRKLPWRSFDAPVLVLACRRDRLVDHSLAERFYAEVRGEPKRLAFIDDTTDPQAHVLAGDVLSPGTTARTAEIIIRFLQSL